MSYKVVNYTHDEFRKCCLKTSPAHNNIISAKLHLTCFQNYFDHIGVRTIIVENDYVNRDFLEDYSSYYVRSFKDYERNCSRLHFFKSVISEDDFVNILKGVPNGITAETLQENYQGFMVLKPLPTTIIGKTCISTYEHAGRRYFPSIRKYNANLFGIPLKVESLAYQEQDSIVAACASSSLWTAFHGTGILFQHSLPSPVEITNWATKHFPFANRHFPNKGLSGEQMAIAIREMGLEPYLYKVDKYDTLKATVSAYLKGKIPIVLGFSLWNNSNPMHPRVFGKHAVTITGYSEGIPLSNNFEGIANLTLNSSKIDKFYVHDDQVGPFARMEFSGNLINGLQSLDTNWNGNIVATPEIIIIPLYHKIRIPFETILNSINHFNNLFIPIIGRIPNFNLFEWDIFLSNIADFKNDILLSTNIGNDDRINILTKKFPKYLWRAVGKINDEKKIEFIFDATDIDQGSSYLATICYDSIVENQYKVLLTGYDSNLMANLSTREMIESFQ